MCYEENNGVQMQLPTVSCKMKDRVYLFKRTKSCEGHKDVSCEQQVFELQKL